MRKIFQLFFAFLLMLVLLPTALQAQERTVSGTIVSEDNKTPLAGVTVKVKGSRRVVQTDANGKFSIKVNPGETLQITYVGYQTTEVKPGSESLGISLKTADNTLGEVVVTAMDIRRNPRELGYSVQTVKGTDIAETQRENFVNSLQGRVAGLTVTPSTGAAGSSTGIVLRGFNSTSGTNQPLFILDGVIIDNTSLNSNSYGGAGVGFASDGANRNVDNTNRIADLNPNDIESVTVLKGPEATALYGSQASNGAIVITTKKGKTTEGKIVINYDNNFRMMRNTRFAKVNNEYSQGTSNGVPTTAPSLGFTSFGPKWAPGTQLFDNIHHFYRTGFAQTHNISVEYGTKNVGLRLSGQYFSSKGVIPFNEYKKYSFKLSNTTKIGKWITITPSIAYSNADNLKPIKGASSYMLTLYEWPANNDIRRFENDFGTKADAFNSTSGIVNYNQDFDNPLWSAKNNRAGDKNTRWVATAGIDFTPFSWLAFAGRFGYDTYQNDGYNLIHPQSNLLGSSGGSLGGTLDSYYRTYKGYNHTITATVKKTIKNFSGRLMFGTMWQDFRTEAFGVFGSKVVDSIVNGRMYKNGVVITSIPTDSSATQPSTRSRLLRNYFGQPNLLIFREIAYFGEASLGFKNMVFLTYSLRYESASPLPKANRNYHYPGASVSVILSDIFPSLKKGKLLNYLKLRASSASTARINDPYSNQAVFVNNTSSSVIALPYTYGFTGTNDGLRPEKQQTFEVGAEMRLLNSKINFEIGYYNTHCTDQIAQRFRASYATGFVLYTSNANELRNEGLEITLGLAAIRKKDFTWNVNFNFNHMWSNVIQIPAHIGPLNDTYNSDTYISNVRAGIFRGHRTGTISGSIYQRNNAGQILISPTTGLPLVTAAGDNRLIGERTPDFTLGTLNSFRYKNWSLSFLWDLKVGGDVYNGTDQVLTGLGKSYRTADRMTPRVVQGVLADGLQNTASPTVNTIVVVPYFQSAYYTSMPDEEFIQHDVNWFRLRDLTLTYRLTKPLFSGMKSMSLFITATDLIVLSNYLGADAAVNANNPGTAGVGGYAMDLGSAPAPQAISFGLKVGF